MDRYDKVVIGAVVMAMIGILIMVLLPVEDGGYGFGLFIFAVFIIKYAGTKRSGL